MTKKLAYLNLHAILTQTLLWRYLGNVILVMKKGEILSSVANLKQEVVFATTLRRGTLLEVPVA